MGDVDKGFHTSTNNYPKNHPSGITVGVNKKAIGIIKDETNGRAVSEFVGLTSKLYPNNMDANNEIKSVRM